jgi:hypothetical protein
MIIARAYVVALASVWIFTSPAVSQDVKPQGLNPTAENATDRSGVAVQAEQSGGRSPLDVLLVVGAAGAEEFGKQFSEWAQRWQANCDRNGLSIQTIGGEADRQEIADRDRIKSVLEQTAAVSSVRPLWIVLIGHGTWDGKSANLNLVGPDISARQLDADLRPIERPIVIVNCTASSGPFIDRLSGENRIVVTATKSGSEQNFTRFGGFFADAFGSLDADLDHDDSVSIREAFLKAAADTQRFYQELGRLATEHALLDDNRDKKGSSYALVLGKAVSKGDGKVDGELASRYSIPVGTDAAKLTDEQIVKRDALESKLNELQQQFDGGDPELLREQALPILLELANLYAAAAEN